MQRLIVLLFVLFACCIEANAQYMTARSIVKVKDASRQEAKAKAKTEKQSRIAEQKGFEQSIELGVTTINKTLAGKSGLKAAFELDYIGGYRFSNVAYLGAGFGVEYHKFGNSYIETDDGVYYNMRYSNISFPLYLHFRAYLTKTKCQPFFFVSAGGIFGTDGSIQLANGNSYKYKSLGIMAVPGFGLNICVSERSSLYVGVAYSLRTYPQVSDFTIKNATLKPSMTHGVSIKLGYTF